MVKLDGPVLLIGSKDAEQKMSLSAIFRAGPSESQKGITDAISPILQTAGRQEES